MDSTDSLGPEVWALEREIVWVTVIGKDMVWYTVMLETPFWMMVSSRTSRLS